MPQNNSRDRTAQVIEEFRTQLPIRAIFEERPGKNPAINRGLCEPGLAPLVTEPHQAINRLRVGLQVDQRSFGAQPAMNLA